MSDLIQATDRIVEYQLDYLEDFDFSSVAPNATEEQKSELVARLDLALERLIKTAKEADEACGSSEVWYEGDLARRAVERAVEDAQSEQRQLLHTMECANILGDPEWANALQVSMEDLEAYKEGNLRLPHSVVKAARAIEYMVRTARWQASPRPRRRIPPPNPLLTSPR